MLSINARPINPGPTCVATAAETLSSITSVELRIPLSSRDRKSFASMLLAFTIATGVARGDRVASFINLCRAVAICFVTASNFVRSSESSITNFAPKAFV